MIDTNPTTRFRPGAAASMPTVAVIGLGYVGTVSAVKLAEHGCRVIGVETNPTKQDMFKQGRCPVNEPGLPAAYREEFVAGRLTVTDRVDEAVKRAQVVMICVGTPVDGSGMVDLRSIQTVTQQLAQALVDHAEPPVVMIRSTVPPGTTRMHVAPTLHAGNPNIVVCHHPEFLREGSAMSDWDRPAMIVIGAERQDRPAVRRQVERIYRGVEAPTICLELSESELMKHACNVFHAIKIDFANEVTALAEAVGADPARVMDTLCCDDKLNISPAYLKPGFAFGGSCLPKDTRSLVAQGQRWGLNLPLMESVLPSNESHLAREVHRVLRHGCRPTLLLGLTFKPGTDDLRESPAVELARRLLGRGVPLTVYDPDLHPAQLVGANSAYIRRHLPNLSGLMCHDLDEALRQAEVIVIAKPMASFARIRARDKTVIDLTRSLVSEQAWTGVTSEPRAGWETRPQPGPARQAA